MLGKKVVGTFIVSAVYQICSVDEIKEVDVDAVCSVHGRDQRCMLKLVGKPEDKIRLGRLTALDVD
jgi:hypothetical protein